MKKHWKVVVAAENTMFSLSWDTEELKCITIECHKMYSEIVECCTSEMFQQWIFHDGWHRSGRGCVIWVQQWCISEKSQVHMFLF